MRYLILVPSNTVDPRSLMLGSIEELHQKIPVVMDCESETQAAAYMRMRYPDAVAMPIPVTVGSGQVVLLGIVSDPYSPVDPKGEIPFVMFVQCTTLRNKGVGFDRKLWKVPVIKPEMASMYQIDLRATDLEIPTYTAARVGSHDGRLAIHVEVGGMELSILFADPRVELKLAPPA